MPTSLQMIGCYCVPVYIAWEIKFSHYPCKIAHRVCVGLKPINEFPFLGMCDLISLTCYTCREIISMVYFRTKFRYIGFAKRSRDKYGDHKYHTDYSRQRGCLPPAPWLPVKL